MAKHATKNNLWVLTAKQPPKYLIHQSKCLPACRGAKDIRYIFQTVQH